LLEALGGALGKKLERAARRISIEALEAMGSGPTPETEAVLHNAINQELDSLSESLVSLRNVDHREIAASALSFITTRELTKHTVGQSIVGLLKYFPPFRMIFPPHEPAYDVTALELPYRLILSPAPARAGITVQTQSRVMAARNSGIQTSPARPTTSDLSDQPTYGPYGRRITTFPRLSTGSIIIFRSA
jgi:hypothetical protein